MKVRVSVADEAKKQADKIDAWWIKNRPAAPDIFWDEFIEALTILEKRPNAGVPVRRVGVQGLRRLRLSTSRVHVYFVHHQDEPAVHVWAVWGSARRTGPPIPKAARR